MFIICFALGLLKEMVDFHLILDVHSEELICIQKLDLFALEVLQKLNK